MSRCNRQQTVMMIMMDWWMKRCMDRMMERSITLNNDEWINEKWQQWMNGMHGTNDKLTEWWIDRRSHSGKICSLSRSYIRPPLHSLHNLHTVYSTCITPTGETTVLQNGGLLIWEQMDLYSRWFLHAGVEWNFKSISGRTLNLKTSTAHVYASNQWSLWTFSINPSDMKTRQSLCPPQSLNYGIIHINNSYCADGK